MSDVVALLDPARPDFATSRFAVLAALRADAPVVFVPTLGCWAVTGMAEVREVLGDPVRYRSGGAFSVAGARCAQARRIYGTDRPLFTYAHIGTDGTLHERLRTPMVAAFRPQRMRQLDAEIHAEIARLADDLFARDPSPTWSPG